MLGAREAGCMPTPYLLNHHNRQITLRGLPAQALLVSMAGRAQCQVGLYCYLWHN